MSDLTAEQARTQADELRAEFHSHELMSNRRLVVAKERDMGGMMEALGIDSALMKDLVPWQSDAPNQEAHLYATALALAEPTVQVYVESEKPGKQKLAEKWERFYQGCIQTIMPDDYDVCRHMAMDGVAVRRLDEDGRFFKDTPKRKKDEEADPYNERVEEYRQGARLPFELPTIDPRTFYYVENRKRTEVTFGCEWTKARESEIKKDGSYSQLGEFLVVRTPHTIRHWWTPSEAPAGEGAGGGTLVYDEQNRFGHTGYFLYRGRYTGLEGEKRYDPFASAAMNVAQILALFMTLQANFAVQAGIHWIESDLPRLTGPADRAVSMERKTKGRGAQQRADSGSAAAEFEPGAHVKFRELAGDYGAILAELRNEFETYRFKDVLMGEASASASGRAIIRLQEAAGKQLAPGFRARKLATEEILTVIRRTLLTRKEYLGGAMKNVYIPYLTEGVGDEDMRKEDLITISQADNIPHAIDVDVAAMSQAAQLAWIEEGIKLEGTFSRDTIDHDFYKIKDLQRENRRRLKDQVRQGVYPAAIKEGVKQALEELGKTAAEPAGVVMPGQDGNGAQPTMARSGQPDAVQTEDAGLAMGPEGGVMPAPEG